MKRKQFNTCLCCEAHLAFRMHTLAAAKQIRARLLKQGALSSCLGMSFCPQTAADFPMPAGKRQTVPCLSAVCRLAHLPCRRFQGRVSVLRRKQKPNIPGLSATDNIDTPKKDGPPEVFQEETA